jgi:hypothetical protein
MVHHKCNRSGFALLMSLLVVSVVISVALTLIDLTIKQLRLASVSRDSEVAFHAANAVVECARFHRNSPAFSNDFESGNPVDINCFNTGDQEVIPIPAGSPTSFQYAFRVDWSVGSAARCSVVNMITISPPIGGAVESVPNMPVLIPGYPVNTKECPPGGRCTVISAQGYNQSCAVAVDNPAGGEFGVIQREVLLEL